MKQQRKKKIAGTAGRRRAAASKLSVTLPRGYRFAATACGLSRTGGLDLGLITSDRPATAAAVFTTNLVQAAPVVLSREHVRHSGAGMRAIVVNSGNANCSTGPSGMAASEATARGVARALGCSPAQVIVCSTGVIGVPLRVERILNRLPELAASLSPAARAFDGFTRAIMTTDTRPKWASAHCRIGGKSVQLLGCAKGAGMIAPNMATMLAFVATDAVIAPVLLRRALRDVVARTFNRITVDGDMSTNDTLAVLANGASGAPAIRSATLAYARFTAALEQVCKKLALAIVADGEGAKRVVEIEVRGAPSEAAADRVARTVATSPLVKTALAGADPNWGRILAAAGRAGVRFDPDRAVVWMAGIKVYARGKALPFDERLAHKKLLAAFIQLVVDLRCHGPESRARPERRRRATSHKSQVWTCDFTSAYVDINASYRT